MGSDAPAVGRREQDRRASGAGQASIDELRSDLRAVAAHELRTPLTTLIGALDTLVGRWGALDDAERL
ncbi:MAG: hypothetical protein JO244_09085, partial [Solirubrobacterales bacterium]|nr:hypothetical protein [Solirubrobacterales bacterium]